MLFRVKTSRVKISHNKTEVMFVDVLVKERTRKSKYSEVGGAHDEEMHLTTLVYLGRSTSTTTNLQAAQRTEESVYNITFTDIKSTFRLLINQQLLKIHIVHL